MFMRPVSAVVACLSHGGSVAKRGEGGKVCVRETSDEDERSEEVAVSRFAQTIRSFPYRLQTPPITTG